MGIASFVLGIISVFCCLLSLFGFSWAAVITGTVGIVFGVIARKNGEGKLATAGFVLSIVGTSIGLLVLLLVVAAVMWAGSVFGAVV